MKPIIFTKTAKKQAQALMKEAPKVASNIGLKLRDISSWTIAWSTLQGEHRGIHKYRVGKYRIIYRFDEEKMYVEFIMKRGKVYRKIK